MDPAEFESRERASLKAAHAGACRAISLSPGGSPWQRVLWHWAGVLERALVAPGRVAAPEPDALPAELDDADAKAA